MTHLTPISTASGGKAAVKKLLTLSGGALHKRILGDGRPETYIRRLPGEDFFWIVKRIGEKDCLHLLQLAAEKKWEYLLDLETWDRDRLDTDKTLAWFKRLCDADPERLSVGLFAWNNALLSLLLSRTTERVLFAIYHDHVRNRDRIRAGLVIYKQADFRWYSALPTGLGRKDGDALLHLLLLHFGQEALVLPCSVML
ncbi:MAG TPA: DUF6178 family protein [Syntrophales bacterium]|nr:DUF6178 family protein [Syntrophales bacterium]